MALLDHSIRGSVHRVLHGGRKDLGLRGGTPEGGGDWSFRTVLIQGRMILSAVGTAGWGGRTTVNNRLKVAAAGAGRIQRQKNLFLQRDRARFRTNSVRSLRPVLLRARTPRKDLQGELPYLDARTSAVGITRDFFQKVTCSTHTPIIVITTRLQIVINLYASA